MPRTGISYEQVATVADAMTAEGGNPTIQKVLYRLGTGSCNTIHKHLNVWKSAHPQMVAAALGSADSSTNAISPKREKAQSEAEVIIKKLVEELSVLTTGREMELLATIYHLMSALAAESQARISAESDVAILTTNLESARIETAKTKHELELQSALLAENELFNNELIEFYKTEHNARRVADLMPASNL
jgi:colicin import membrane protein